MSGIGRLHINLGYQVIYRILTTITPLITAPILSRALGAEGLGKYSATLALVNYFMHFAMLGVENYGIRSIAAVQNDRAKQQKLFWSIYAVQFSASIIAILGYSLAILFVERERFLLSLLQGLWLLGSMLDINWFFFGCEQFKATVTRSIFVKIATVICIFFFVRTPNDLLIYACIMAGGTALGHAVMWFPLFKQISFEKVRPEEIKIHIRPVFQLFIPVLAFSVFHIMDKTMLDWISDEVNLGYYYSADKVINIPLGIIYAVGTVMLPRIANILHNDSLEAAKRMLKKSTELTMFLVASIGFGIAAIAEEFVPLFFGPGYEPCVQLIYCFVPVLAIKAFSNLIRTQYLIPAQKDKLYTKAVFMGALTNLLLNCPLIKCFGALGAVLGTLAAEFVVLIVEVREAKKEIPFISYLIRNAAYLVPGFIMAISVHYFLQTDILNGWLQLFFSVLLGAAIYLTGCFLVYRFKHGGK